MVGLLLQSRKPCLPSLSPHLLALLTTASAPRAALALAWLLLYLPREKPLELIRWGPKATGFMSGGLEGLVTRWKKSDRPPAPMRQTWTRAWK